MKYHPGSRGFEKTESGLQYKARLWTLGQGLCGSNTFPADPSKIASPQWWWWQRFIGTCESVRWHKTSQNGKSNTHDIDRHEAENKSHFKQTNRRHRPLQPLKVVKSNPAGERPWKGYCGDYGPSIAIPKKIEKDWKGIRIREWRWITLLPFFGGFLYSWVLLSLLGNE